MLCIEILKSLGLQGGRTVGMATAAIVCACEIGGICSVEELPVSGVGLAVKGDFAPVFICV